MSSFTAVSGRAQLLRPSKSVRARNAACNSVRRVRVHATCCIGSTYGDVCGAECMFDERGDAVFLVIKKLWPILTTTL